MEKNGVIGNLALKIDGDFHNAGEKNYALEKRQKLFLSPKFCMHNGAVVLSNNGSLIRFGLLDSRNFSLRQKLETAAKEENLDAEFEAVSKNEFEKNVSQLLSFRKKEDLPFFLEHDDFFSEIESDFQGNRDNQDESEEKDGENEKRSSENKFEDETQMFSSSEIVLLLSSILNEARLKNATDIHLENKAVRFRMNGHLELYMEVGYVTFLQLIQRIKMLAKLNVMEKKSCQDGQFVFEDGLFVRVSTVPIINGESIVLRLLDKKRLPLKIENLGFSELQTGRLRSFEKLENGLVLICGPTGSGKSTTAASILSEIDQLSRNGKKIITIEDPCEYILNGITQIKTTSSLSFQDALKHVFRQDPDVMFIGEIRDETTAKIALQASLTGHLVFATLHTSGFSETILRLKNLGIPLSFVSQVLKGIVMQKLTYEANFDGEIKPKLSGEVLAVNSMAKDAIIKGEDKVFMESVLKGLAI